MSCGIYKIENLINHKCYIGQSINIEFRFQKHKNASDNFLIHKAFKKYGIENFSFTIIEECSKKELDEKEKFWIKQYNSLTPNGYNMIPGGSNGAGLSKGKSVEQYSLEGKLIKIFNSAHQAEEKTGINYSNICSCCRGERKQAGPFQWKYTDSNKQIEPIKGRKNKVTILQCDLNDNIIKEYSTLEEAANAVQCSKALICRVCKGKGKTAKKYKWKYKEN